MLKTITKSAIFSAFVLGLMTVANQVALAAAKCTVNGREVPCEELGNQVKGFLGWGIGYYSCSSCACNFSNNILDNDDCSRRAQPNKQ
jgi:hypothetical protein